MMESDWGRHSTATSDIEKYKHIQILLHQMQLYTQHAWAHPNEYVHTHKRTENWYEKACNM